MLPRTMRRSGSRRQSPARVSSRRRRYQAFQSLARAAGVVRVDRFGVDKLNRVDPAITLATVPEYAPSRPGRWWRPSRSCHITVAGKALDQRSTGRRR
ncbi:MAG: hypothetical protein R3D02_09645 [Hyphomicrobiales bacterium]